MAKTSTAAMEVPFVDADGDDASEDDDLDLNYGGDEPEVTKIICKER